MKATTTTTTTVLLRVLLWLGASMSALGSEVRITNVDDFIQFRDNVFNGMTYDGTTVFLDSDLSLDGKSFEPIGNTTYYFSGVFDGQGHVISNLTMTSSSQYVGLFGYSTGLTIKNAILDSSCSIKSSFSSGYAFVGGIIGHCNATDGPCTIENSVNMGSVTFGGTLSGNNYSFLGGMAGHLSPSNHDSAVKNCANYGDITHSGESGGSRIGGILGEFRSDSSSNRVPIFNSLNYGTITLSGTIPSNLRLGGIVGRSYFTTIENCVSGGKISLLTTPSSNNFTGSIVGYGSDETSINYTYFTSYLSGYGKYGGNDSSSSESNTLSYDSTSFELSGTVSIGGYSGTSLIGALNAASDSSGGNSSHWLLNKGNNVMSFFINGELAFTQNTQIILLPSLASEGNMSFDGWYEDAGLTTPLTNYEVTRDTSFYGKLEGSSEKCTAITATLDVNGGDDLAGKEMTIGCDRVYGDLPEPTRAGHTFLGWFTGKTGGDKVESGGEVTILSDHTLCAHWSINNYTLTFIFGNGTEPEVRVFEFNEEITYPADPVREGYSFTGWDSNITSMPADNTNVTAQWRANNYTVTFNPSGGSVSQQSTKVVTFGSAYGELPTPNRTGFTFLGWFTEKNESITAGSIVEIPDNHTLYANWFVNKYTLTFIFGNGTDPEVQVLEFNETITYPNNVTREGYLFNGWDNNITNMPASNLNITAQWIEIVPELVEIVFGKKDMTEKEIKGVIKEYAQGEFIIAKIEDDETGGTRVIVKFEDVENATEFVRNVNAVFKRGEVTLIKRVGFVQEGTLSFSSAHHPMSLLYLI